MKLIVQKLDNGYTLSIVRTVKNENGKEEEHRQRLIYPSKDDLVRTIQEIL